MRIDNITNTNFQAKIILAEKNNSLIKKAIKSSFSHEELKENLDKIYNYEPKTTLLVQMKPLLEPKYGRTHEIIITNQSNEQSIETDWGEEAPFSWSFGELIERLTKLTDDFVYDFWCKPAIKKAPKLSILRHEIFADEKDFDYDKHIKECEQKDMMDKLSHQLDHTSSSLEGMVREYKFDKKISRERENYSESAQYYPSAHTNYYSRSDEENEWREINRVKELRAKYPEFYSDKDSNRAIWAATMGRNCNK